LPSAVLKNHHVLSAISTPATAPASAPPSRAPSTAAPATASSPPVRATSSHSAGAGSPVSDSGVVTTTGSGFHDGPPLVSSAKRLTSRPHTTHACGSNARAHGSNSETAASAAAAPITAAVRLKPPR
jgi:hypothetical protein